MVNEAEQTLRNVFNFNYFELGGEKEEIFNQKIFSLESSLQKLDRCVII